MSSCGCGRGRGYTGCMEWVYVAHCSVTIRWVESFVCLPPLANEFIKYGLLPLVPTGGMNLL